MNRGLKPRLPAAVAVFFFALFVSAWSSVAGQQDGEKTRIARNTFLNVPATDRSTASKIPAYGLDDLLIQRALPDRTILFTSVSSGYLDLFENWRCSLRKTNFRNYIVFASDLHSYDTLMAAGEPVIADPEVLAGNTFDYKGGNAEYATTGFERMMLRRVYVIVRILQKGYHVYLNDIDTVWSRSPVPYLPPKTPGLLGNIPDFIAQDEHNHRCCTDHTPGHICTGNLIIRTTEKAKALWQEVVDELAAELNKVKDRADDKAIHVDEQDLINHKALSATWKEKLLVYFWADDEFPSGKRYFDVQAPQKAGVVPVVVHNTWIVGHDQKVNRFKANGHWLLSDLRSNGASAGASLVCNVPSVNLGKPANFLWQQHVHTRVEDHERAGLGRIDLAHRSRTPPYPIPTLWTPSGTRYYMSGGGAPGFSVTTSIQVGFLMRYLDESVDRMILEYGAGDGERLAALRSLPQLMQNNVPVVVAGIEPMLTGATTVNRPPADKSAFGMYSSVQTAINAGIHAIHPALADVIFSLDVIGTEDCPVCKLRELGPLLRTGGKLILISRNIGALPVTTGPGSSTASSRAMIYTSPMTVRGVTHTYNPAMLTRTVARAGFQVTASHYVHLASPTQKGGEREKEQLDEAQKRAQEGTLIEYAQELGYEFGSVVTVVVAIKTDKWGRTDTKRY